MILPSTWEYVSETGGRGGKKERDWRAHAEEGIKRVALIILSHSINILIVFFKCKR